MPNQSTAFCPECGCYVPYSVNSTRETSTVRGVAFSYVEMHAHCKQCNEPLYVPEVNDANVLAREEGYRKAAKLITKAEVNELLAKYNIGAGPLAKLLGFGEVTINRYLGGQLPSKDHSDLLLRLRSSHKTMESYLESGRDKISAVAYEKCRLAIDTLNDLYGSGKIELVTRYILWKADDITPLALQKLLYYAQAFYKGLFGEDLFLDNCQAWAHGPVYPDVYYKYKEYGYNPIDKPTEDLTEDFGRLTTREISLIDAIVDSFGQYSGTVLRDITHNEKPWLDARGSLLPTDRCVTVISRKSIDDYFQSVIKQYQIVNPCDISKYCFEMRRRTK